MLMMRNVTLSVAQAKPFRMEFISDLDEVVEAAATNTNEQDDLPGGIVGFSLNWVQQSC